MQEVCRKGKFLSNEFDNSGEFDALKHFTQSYSHESVFTRKFYTLKIPESIVLEKFKDYNMILDNKFGNAREIVWEISGDRLGMNPIMVHFTSIKDSEKLKELNKKLDDLISEDEFLIPEELSGYVDWKKFDDTGEMTLKSGIDDERIDTPRICNYICIISASKHDERFNNIINWYKENSALAYNHEIKKDNVFILNLGSNGFCLKPYDIDGTTYGHKIIEDNYNEDFSEAYERLIKFIEEDESGIALLPGVPGSGKTSIILHLATLSEKLCKRFVILPSSFISILSDPSFTEFALNSMQNSILCIEDAEEILRNRDSGRSEHMAVTNILNISDGILGKIVKLKIICTLNNDGDIDKAILRKGRLKLKYKFNMLSKEKATKLSEKLGINKIYDKPVTLADVYNELDKNNFEIESKKSMGFGR